MSVSFENEVKVVVGTQKIIVDRHGELTVVRAGPMGPAGFSNIPGPVPYTHLRAHETPEHLVCRFLLTKK